MRALLVLGDGAALLPLQPGRAMSAAEDARATLNDLTRNQLRAALMCLWVKDPTSFWAAIESARKEVAP